MTGQAAEAVSLCLKMPQGICLRQLWEKGASEGTAALFSGALWQQFFLMGIAAPLSEELLFRGILFERLRMALPFSGRHLDRRHFRVGAWKLGAGIYAALMGLILAWLYEKEPSGGTCVISQCSKFDGDADAGASPALVRT